VPGRGQGQTLCRGVVRDRPCVETVTFDLVRTRSVYVVLVPRQPRQELPEGVFHVTTRGVNKEPIVADDEDRRAFVRLLRDTARRFDWRCHAYCLMTTHYHLLVGSSREELSRGLGRLNGFYAQGFNKRHGRRGHLFGDRFSAFVVEGEEYLEAACRYILLNPVRAGLCAAADEWPWSGSYFGKNV
jgi:putative transposase